MTRRRLRAVRGDPAQDHESMDELLGWYVNGTLEESAVRRVESHIGVCDECRRRDGTERALALMMREAPAVELAPQAGLAAVMERIERRESRRRFLGWPWRLLGGEGELKPLVLAVGVQALVIVMLTAVLWVKLAPAPDAVYRTLSSSPPPMTAASGTALLRVVLDDEMTLGALRAALAPWPSRIVAGPEARGIYTLAVEGDAEAVVSALRATRGVQLAEVVSGR